jgi:hypothetical protein
LSDRAILRPTSWKHVPPWDMLPTCRNPLSGL